MSRFIKGAYHFLGGVYFAIILIAVTAVLVTAGTLMESHTGSHQYAEQLVYGTPLFSLLLWGFFINILFAALRRWPFKKRHIPFLITHWGLLMILGGTLIKHYAGMQGSLFLLEGSSTDQLMIPDTQALRIDTPEGPTPAYLALPLTSSNRRVGSYEISTEHCFPHCSERLDTFVKGDWTILAGVPPFPLETPTVYNIGGSDWTLLAKRGDDIEAIAREYYANNTIVRLKDPASGEVIHEATLGDILQKTVLAGSKPVKAALQMDLSTIGEMAPAQLTVHIDSTPIEIALAGPKALYCRTEDPPMGSPPIEVDLSSKPTLLFLQDEHHDVILAAIGIHGDISAQAFRANNLTSLYSYDQGFGGYSMQAVITTARDSREEAESLYLARLKQEIARAASQPNLTPPLQLLRDSCARAGTDFADTCVSFLQSWSKSGGWLYPQEKPLDRNMSNAFAALDWSAIPNSEFKGSAWSSALVGKIDEQSKDAKGIIQVLEANGWPFVGEITRDPQSRKKSYVLTAFTNQVFAAADELPTPPETAVKDPQAAAHLFSAYCRAYGIHLSTLMPHQREEDSFRKTTLECPLSTTHKLVPPSAKLEENVPLLIVKVKGGGKPEKLALSFDRQAQGLKWPVADGSLLFRFQPLFTTLPYEVRLRRARQISYPHSQQPYSYESDLIVTDKRTGAAVEATVSMNNVHETWDGYRFYLSSMSPSDESAAKRIQLVVNLDPAKYFLTYPGAVILSLGIVLLFWLRPYKRPEDREGK